MNEKVCPTLRERVSGVLRSDAMVVLFFAATNLLLHLICIDGYGYFRDELYYISCSNHLAFGYVDHPALAMVVLRGIRFLFGDSLPALRLLPVISASLLVVGTGLLAKELGGKRFSLALSCAAASGVIGNLFLFHNYSMNSLDHLFWMACFLLLVKILKGGNPRLWLLFGAVAGLGLQNKISLLFLLLGTALCLLLLPELRVHLKSPILWIGGLLALLIFLPYILWNFAHQWPLLEFMRNAGANKIAVLPPLVFLREQILYNNPNTLLIWTAGLGYFLFHPQGKRFRLFGLIYLLTYLIFNLQNSKTYYLAPAYPVLFAGGAVFWERLLQKGRLRIFRPLMVGAIWISTLLLSPLVLPLLPVEKYIVFAKTLGFQQEPSENHRMGPLPQTFADMFGWRETTAKVVAVYRSLPEGDRTRCLIYGDNYGVAGALDFFGREAKLPPVFSGHNNHYFWPPQGRDGEVMITVGADMEDLREIFREFRQVGRTYHPYAMPYENDKPICLARGLKIPLQEVLKRAKHFE